MVAGVGSTPAYSTNNKFTDMEQIQDIDIKRLEVNKGQVEGLPKNPRFIRDERYKALVKSIEDAPEMLKLRELLVVEHGNKFVVIGGNMRLRACKELGMETVPCKVLPADTPVAKLREYAIKDNNGFGEDDWDILANEWDAEELQEWGMELPMDWDVDGGEALETTEHPKAEKDEDVECLLNEAMRQNLKECYEQINYTMKKGWLISGLTLGMCKAKFIRAKYYGEKYPQYLAVYFTPQMFFTSANTVSIYDQIEKIVKGKTDAGVAGFRTFTEDGNVTTTTTRGSYPVAGARLPLDFPSNRAAELYNEFCPTDRKPDILDPCHGWGGRLVGALLVDANSYTGIDPSNDASSGANKIANAYKDYAPDTNVRLIKACFEDVDLDAEAYDIALTSPPYFDVEQYKGENQSHVKFPKYDLWVNGFYRPLIEKTFNALRNGGVFILQVGSQSYPLRQDGEKIAKEIGFTVEDVRPLGGQTNSPMNGNTDDDYENEKIIILRK